MTFKIKGEHSKRKVGFAGDSKPQLPLGEKSQADLAKLAAIALDSKNRTLLELFEGDLADVKLEDLQKTSTKKAITELSAKQK